MREHWIAICHAALGIVLAAAYTLTMLRASSVHAGESKLSRLTGTIWVTREKGNTVAKVEGATGKVLAVIPVGKSPVDLVAPKGTGKVYVSNESENTVSVIDKATATVKKRSRSAPARTTCTEAPMADSFTWPYSAQTRSQSSRQLPTWSSAST